MNQVPLREVATFINGRAFKPDDWAMTGLPIIRIQNLTGSSSVVNYYDNPVESKYLVNRGDILISWSASLGVYVWSGDLAILNQHIFKVIPKIGVDRQYFYYAASSVLEAMKAQVHGTTMQHITKEPFESTLLPLPPLPEQQRIATILAKADRLRRLRRYALDLGESYLQSVFLEMFGDPVANPKRWPIGIIEDVVTSTQYGTSEKSNSEHKGYPVLGMGNITYSGEIDLTNLAYVDLSSKEFEKLRLEPGDIIFNRTNSTELVGKTACWKYNLDAVIASYLVRIKLNDEILPDYFASLLNTRYFKGLLQERCKKAVGQSNISPTLLQEFPVLKPSIPLQQKFAQIVHKYERLHAQQREAARQTEHLFQTLLHRAFAGEL